MALTCLCAWCVLETSLRFGLSASVVAALSLLLATQFMFAWRKVSQRLHIRFIDNQWKLSTPGNAPSRVCVLRCPRYRSSWLIILEFESESGERMEYAFWRGSVTQQTFSRLHFAAAYGCDTLGDNGYTRPLGYTGPGSRIRRVIAALRRKV